MHVSGRILLRGLLLSVGILPGALSMAAAVSVPSTLNVQGRLTDNSPAQNPLDGTVPMQFSIYDAPVAGTQLWTESWSFVSVTQGLFDVALGSVTPIPPGVFDASADRWLSIIVNGEELLPRQKLSSVPYAVVADSAATLDGKVSAEFLDTSAAAQVKAGAVGIGTTGPPTHRLTVEAPDSATVQLLGPGSAGSESRLDFGDAGAVYVGEPAQNELELHAGLQTSLTGGPVGIGTTAPTATLHVQGTTLLDGDLTVTGTIQSAAGGIRFPDGSVQTSAIHALPPDVCFDNVGRFVVCGNGTVKDNLTGLFWLENADCLGEMSWADANIAAAQLADGQCGLADGSSAGDWRLPTAAEWQAIVDQAALNGCSAPFVPDIDGSGCCGAGTCAFSSVRAAIGERYASGTTLASGPSFAAFGNLNNGTVGYSAKATTLGFFWPVRASP